MKKTSLILNVVLILAVAVLYILHFACPKTCATSSGKADSTITSTSVSGDIVYINIDSVYSNYDMYKDVIEELQVKLNTSEAEIQTKQRNFQKKVQDFQYKLEKQLMTRAEAEALQQTLAQEEQSLMALSQQMQYKLAEEEQVAQRKVLNSIMEYLKKIENEQPYKFVMGTSFGGNILYANDELDISKSLITGLNEAYSKIKEESKE